MTKCYVFLLSLIVFNVQRSFYLQSDWNDGRKT